MMRTVRKGWFFYLQDFGVYVRFILSNKLRLVICLFLPIPIGNETKVKACACNVQSEMLKISVIY